MAPTLGNWSALDCMSGMNDAEFASQRRRRRLSTLVDLRTSAGLPVFGLGVVMSFAHSRLSRVPHKQALAYLRNP